MADLAFVMRYLGDQKQENYPDALIFGVSFAGQLISAFSKENYPFDYTPASIISQNMLNKGMPNDFEFSIQYRHQEETGSFDVNPEEIQGYIDSVTLYMAACFTAMNRLPVMFMDEALGHLPQFAQLPIEVQSRSQKFIMENTEWAAKELLAGDLDDGKGFMNKLVRRVEEQKSNRFYQRGSRTARDTLLLYVVLIQAFLAGKFGRKK